MLDEVDTDDDVDTELEVETLEFNEWFIAYTISWYLKVRCNAAFPIVTAIERADFLLNLMIYEYHKSQFLIVLLRQSLTVKAV